MSKTHKYWKGWHKQSPGVQERTVMLRKCGKKCFLGKNKSFPICKKNTCKISGKGIYSAYIRANQYSSKNAKYKRISSNASKMLIKMGIKK